MKVKFVILLLFSILGIWFSGLVFAAEGAALYLKPSDGTFYIGDTFDVSVYVDTGGRSINAINVDLDFPSDKLQVISPTLGQSLISFWLLPPTFSNAAGTISLQGGIPSPGIRTSQGLVTTVTFRVVNTGKATISFRDTASVFLADGTGADILQTKSGAMYSFYLPPPAGPKISSPTHPNPDSWYLEKDVEFVWQTPQGANAVSYVLDKEPLTVPDNISEGGDISVIYRDLPSGTHYFHIKSLSPETGWGKTSHFVVNIDYEPPADFEIEVSPSSKTSVRQPTLFFETSDANSGLNRYVLQVTRVSKNVSAGIERFVIAPFFIEVISPFLLSELDYGTYNIVVRAYDLAGNFRETSQKLVISQALFRGIGPEGVNFLINTILPWWLVYLILLVAAGLILYAAHFAYRRHREVEHKLASGLLHLLGDRINKRLRILQEKRGEFEKNKFNK